MHHISIDQALTIVDTALRTLSGVRRPTRKNPAEDIKPVELSVKEKKESGRLMRVNHCGEVCAQALYLGQRITSKENITNETLKKSADEEADHLAWCEERLRELETKPSYLNPAFFAMSFMVGAVAGIISDRLSLGFVAATEEKVVDHLELHLKKLPKHDEVSRAILEQMRKDETSHQASALDQGGFDFPPEIKQLMNFTSQIMTRTTYWV